MVSLTALNSQVGTVLHLEKVGYLAMEEGPGAFVSDGTTITYSAQRVDQLVQGFDDGATTVMLDTDFVTPPLVVASLTSRIGYDGGWIRMASATSISADVYLDEDVYCDAERAHRAEDVALMAWSGQGDWQSFSFATAFAEPPVVVVLSTGMGEPQDVKVRSVTTTGFEALLVVPPPGTGNLPAVTAPWTNGPASYIAVLPGLHRLPDGRIFEAGLKETSTVYFSSEACVPTTGRRQWGVIWFQNIFTRAVVVTKLQTANNEQGSGGASKPWLVPAVKGVATNKFLYTLETGETQAGSVAQKETVGYIAMEEGRQQLQLQLRGA
eukprot:Skav223576  [mRNA]  locus=scaffold2909:50242:53410:+ [translate_table: standard]